MSKLFSVGRSLQAQAQPPAKTDAPYDLVGPGGFVTLVKYAVYAVLAALNLRLFLETLGYGVWGACVGLVAILTEGMAIYCWRNQIRSADRHRQAMVFFAIAFTALSLAHGCCSLWELSGAGQKIERVLWFYSYFIAFPLMFGLLVVCVCVLFLTHWQTKISKAHATAQTEIAKSDAELRIEQAKLRQTAAIEESRLDHVARMIGIENQYTQKLETLIAVKERQRQALGRLSDPEIRDEVLGMLGKVAKPAAPEKRISPLPAPTLAQDQPPNPQANQS